MATEVIEVPRASTLELFFDLVFVFTLTQLTAKLAGNLTWQGLAQVLLMLGVIWWMYGGYVWMTNAVSMDNTLRRTFLMAGMSGFLLIALAIPHEFVERDVVFGLGYLVVTAVHTLFLAFAQGPRMRQVMVRLAPLNLGSATLVLIAGVAPTQTLRYVFWTIAVVMQISTPYLYPVGQGFSLTPEHFVERHGLVIIIALGESIVAMGVGLAGLELTPGLIAMSILGLVLSYHLWWSYFGWDNERAEHAFAHITDTIRRSRVAVNAFGYAHFPMLLGIVMMSAGLKKTIGHPTEHTYQSTSLLMAGGAALFLLGETGFRRVLRIGGAKWRLAGSAALMGTVPIGVLMSGILQVIAMIGVLATMFAIEWHGPEGEQHRSQLAQPS